MIRRVVSLAVVSLVLWMNFSSSGWADDNIAAFDGQSLEGWVTQEGRPVTKGWEVVDGMIHLDTSAGRAGHILTKEEFGDFDLAFEWKVAKGANSGIKYRVRWYDTRKGRRPLGCEFQLLDDANLKNAQNPVNSAGALYDLYAPSADKPLQAVGQWNKSRILVHQGHIEHWLNGKKIVEADIGSADWHKRIAKSKFAKIDRFAEEPRGAILLQDHKGEVWFRNFRFKALDAKPE